MREIERKTLPKIRVQIKKKKKERKRIFKTFRLKKYVVMVTGDQKFNFKICLEDQLLFKF